MLDEQDIILWHCEAWQTDGYCHKKDNSRTLFSGRAVTWISSSFDSLGGIIHPHMLDSVDMDPSLRITLLISCVLTACVISKSQASQMCPNPATMYHVATGSWSCRKDLSKLGSLGSSWVFLLSGPLGTCLFCMFSMLIWSSLPNSS